VPALRATMVVVFARLLTREILSIVVVAIEL